MRTAATDVSDVEVLVLAVSAMHTTLFDRATVEREITRLPGVRRVIISTSVQAVLVEYRPAELDASYVVAAALNAGCHAEPFFGW